MNFGWESEKDKIERSMKVSPKHKMEWLQKMHELLLAIATPKRRKVFWRMRGIK